jgi:hypothetical protein
MTWALADIAAVAEILGLVAVVPSLIFVGVQLARSNREARAATIQATMDSDREASATLAEHAETWDKVVTGAPLADGAETRRAILLFNVLMVDTEGRYHQYQTGFLDAKAWQARYAASRKMVSLPIYKTWRQSGGAASRSEDFLEILDRLASEAQS